MNNNSIKRLARCAGITRVKGDLLLQANELGGNYLTILLKRLTILLHFSNKKTIKVEDLQILHKFFPEYPIVLGEKFETILAKRGFKRMLQEILQEIDGEILVAEKTTIILQVMFENYLREKLFN